MPAVSIEELPIPSSVDDLARAKGGRVVADFVEMVRLRNAVETATLGTDALSCTAAELLPHYTSPEFEPKIIVVARVDDRIVGRGVLQWSIAAGTTSSWVNVEVLPEFRSRGLGSTLLAEVESRALAAARPILQAEAMHSSASGGARLPSPTGFGDLPADDAGVRFLTAHGYRLEQIERCSFLDLPADPSVLNPAFERAATMAGPDYRVVSWVGPTPDDRIDDLILLRTRMSTDAPAIPYTSSPQPSAVSLPEPTPWSVARAKTANERKCRRRHQAYPIRGRAYSDAQTPSRR